MNRIRQLSLPTTKRLPLVSTPFNDHNHILTYSLIMLITSTAVLALLCLVFSSYVSLVQAYVGQARLERTQSSQRLSRC